MESFPARTDNRTIQNSKAFYAILSKSVTGTIHNIIFRQTQNLPSDKDGVSLFKLFTSFTDVASLQLSILSFQTNHEPPSVNVQLSHPRNQHQSQPSVPARSYAHPRLRRRKTYPTHSHCVHPHQATSRMVFMVPHQYRRCQICIHHHLK